MWSLPVYGNASSLEYARFRSSSGSWFSSKCAGLEDDPSFSIANGGSVVAVVSVVDYDPVVDIGGDSSKLGRKAAGLWCVSNRRLAFDSSPPADGRIWAISTCICSSVASGTYHRYNMYQSLANDKGIRNWETRIPGRLPSHFLLFNLHG